MKQSFFIGKKLSLRGACATKQPLQDIKVDIAICTIHNLEFMIWRVYEMFRLDLCRDSIDSVRHMHRQYNRASYLII